MNRERLWLLLPSPVRNLPADLAAVLALVVLTNLTVFLPVVNDSPVRVVVGLAFVLFVPGYAFIAALFPEEGTSPDAEAAADEAASETNGGDGLQDRGIDGIERTALSFGLSIAIVPLIGLALNFTPFGIRLVPILVSISAFTVIATGVAAQRRWQLPDDERFRVPYRSWLGAGKSELFAPDSTADAALNVLLVLSILLATSSVVYAVAVPQQGEQFTEFYVLTENETGDLVADDYPEELVADQPQSVHVGVGNNEYETVEYTVVVQLQAVEIRERQTPLANQTQVDAQANGTRLVVTDRTELDRFSTTVPHNESDIRNRTLVVDSETATQFSGSDRRVKFLLYRDGVPAQPTADNAYRDLHLWVEVRADDQSNA
ncbi:DUF1616 domain-containing protein [Natronomonas marina]|jgi:uncharacterized membrane protein|uniref:DUF1616 domain-containing protein n=1 Tax=Natronomonas marina TaxID=2961939 RepID=UPI0020C9A651|nr:DUF1616 domain-containing protein [Natronomonas marina]